MEAQKLRKRRVRIPKSNKDKIKAKIKRRFGNDKWKFMSVVIVLLALVVLGFVFNYTHPSHYMFLPREASYKDAQAK